MDESNGLILSNLGQYKERRDVIDPDTRLFMKMYVHISSYKKGEDRYDEYYALILYENNEVQLTHVYDKNHVMYRSDILDLNLAFCFEWQYGYIYSYSSDGILQGQYRDFRPATYEEPPRKLDLVSRLLRR